MSLLIYKLDKESKELILAQLQFNNMLEVILGHVTLYNDPLQFDLPRLERLFTDTPDVKLIGFCSDYNAVVALVSVNGMLDREATFKGRYHVTVAVGYGIRPVYANKLILESNVIVNIPPVQLHGNIKLIN